MACSALTGVDFDSVSGETNSDAPRLVIPDPPVRNVKPPTREEEDAGEEHDAGAVADASTHDANASDAAVDAAHDAGADAPAPDAGDGAVPLAAKIAGVTAGTSHTCAWTTGGAVYCWGDNSQGQLGAPLAMGAQYTDTPKLVLGLADIAGVSAGSRHTLAWNTRGEIYAWGSNDHGQVGIAAAAGGKYATPQRIVSLADIAGAAAGDDHGCAWTRAGAVSCWGAGSSGQLGVGPKIDAPQPRALASLVNVAGVAGGGAHTCAWTNAGAAYCWGAGKSGQLGIGSLPKNTDDVATPQALALTGVSGMSAGDGHTCSWNAARALSCWGEGDSGRLGLGSVADKDQPTAVATAGVATLGTRHTCSRSSVDGALACWGNNSEHQLGLGSAAGTADKLVPTALGATAAKGVSAGAFHTCAWGESEIFCWGRGTSGQLGTGPAAVTAKFLAVPTKVNSAF